MMVTKIASIQWGDLQKRDHQSTRDSAKKKSVTAFGEVLAKELVGGGGKQLAAIK